MKTIGMWIKPDKGSTCQIVLAIITLCVIMCCMIVSFGNKDTEKLFVTGKSKKLPSTIIKAALRKLDYLNRAKSLQDLEAPPGNRLEALKRDLKGKFSIRINDQFRIVFRFSDNEASEVEVTDYH
jgi:proteic killer suppression protein